MEKSKNKVLLGLSGGVDSTAAALLLKEKGLEVIGYYFDTSGCNEAGIAEAKAVADQLGIEFLVEDVSALFDSKVIKNFCDEYMCGRTPNPCVVCNPLVKFTKLIENADKVGAYYIATGHYAGIAYDADSDYYYIRTGENLRKDQSYMLYRLGQEVLSRLIFPLGEVSDKEETRNLARSQNLINADKKDSQEICFVPDDDYVAYIEARGYNSKPGKFVSKDGKVLGNHKGIIHYTMGQRKGLGVALGKPAFVTKIDSERNQVVLGDNDELFTTEVSSTGNFFTAHSASYYDGMTVLAKVRYSARPTEAVLHVENVDVAEDFDGCGCNGSSAGSVEKCRVKAVFTEPQRAATPGQSIVFYDGDKVIGGGFIE